MSLLTPSKSYKPFRYPWAFDLWKKQQQVHWLPEEVPLGEDIRDWAQALTPAEKNLLTQLFRFFTQADVDVQNCYMKKYASVFQPTEVGMMLTAFSNMECFDDQSELLTDNGWKNVRDVTSQDKIAQYNISTGEVSFVLPKKVVSYPYKGVMHHYKSMTSDIMVTPNHDMIARHPITGKVDKVKSYARKLGKNYTYPASGISTAEHLELTALDRILVAVQADGCLRGNCPSAGEWYTVDFTLHKERKIERLCSLLDEAGISYSRRCPDETGRVRISFSMPKTVDLTKVKTLGFVDLTATSAQRAMDLIDEIVFWDGTVNPHTGQRAYYSTNKLAADTVQALASITGTMMATLGVNREAGVPVTLPSGDVITKTKTCYVVTFTEDRVEKTYPHREEVDYDGRVYCVSVDTENLISRRNGKVAFTGNTVHIAAYSHLLDTIGMPESEYLAFLEYDQMRDKHDYMAQFGMDTPQDVLTTLAMFGGFTEGVQLFASFAMLLNFPRRNLMKGMGQIVSWSVRDESLHCEGITRLFRAFAQETGALNEEVRRRIYEHAHKVVQMEDRFIDLAFEMGPVEGMTAEETKRYVRFITDWRLRQLDLEPIFGIKEHPLPWLVELLNGVEHANFFETRATEYSKAATSGSWEDTWSRFDQKVRA